MSNVIVCEVSHLFLCVQVGCEKITPYVRENVRHDNGWAQSGARTSPMVIKYLLLDHTC